MLSVGGFFFERRQVRIGLFLTRAVAIALIIAPLSEYNATKPLLLFSFFLEIGFELGPPVSIVLSVLSSLFVVGLAQTGARGHPEPLLETPVDLLLQYLLYVYPRCIPARRAEIYLPFGRRLSSSQEAAGEASLVQ
jgi:hypothetical protein